MQSVFRGSSWRYELSDDTLMRYVLLRPRSSCQPASSRRGQSLSSVCCCPRPQRSSFSFMQLLRSRAALTCGSVPRTATLQITQTLWSPCVSMKFLWACWDLLVQKLRVTLNVCQTLWTCNISQQQQAVDARPSVSTQTFEAVFPLTTWADEVID